MMLNPFQPTKFEHENRPVVWLSPWARSLAKTKKPDFVVGTRGSGKTTVLRSLHTKTLIENDFLAQQYGYKGRTFHWFGCYMQFNHSFQHLTEQVLNEVSKVHGRTVSELNRYKLFCSFFELSVLESLLEDLRSLEDRELIHFSGRKEKRACDELREILNEIGVADVNLMSDYNDALRLVRHIRGAFLATYDQVRIADAISAMDAFTPTTIIKFIRESIVPSIRSERLPRGKEVDLYILLDDCENLSDLQQRALNTYLRSTEGIAKWVVAYVRGQYNTIQTTIPETSLSHADRNICDVDDRSEEDFRNFCESVATLRLNNFLRSSLSENVRENTKFELSKCGRPSYNILVSEILEGYQSAAVQKFKSEVGTTKAKLASVIGVGQRESFHVSATRMPYVEHVVISSLDLDVLSFGSEPDQTRLRKELHRKSAAAYIIACRVCKRPPLYAGDRFVLWASDGNIRDFLDVMAEMFSLHTSRGASSDNQNITLAKACRRFLNSEERFSIKIQDRCIRNVSHHSYETIQGIEDSGEPHIFYLLSGLAELQRILHHYNENGEAVRYPERGIFKVNVKQFSVSASEYEFSNLYGLLRRIERDGFIRLEENRAGLEREDVAFRLHRRLCPVLDCSPRGAYEQVRIDPRLLVRLLSQSDPVSPKLWAEDYFDRMVGHDRRQQRFDV
ncbi:ORC-CDC6 family AAA ATPase [Roseovarius sp. D22-M7]|uniref:ORC-CDC6 family AAA ATPase n=1 Tax=Roseovarius sp. D22-M7 TaxID=3127116 RepID=UPI00300FD99B